MRQDTYRDTNGTEIFVSHNLTDIHSFEHYTVTSVTDSWIVAKSDKTATEKRIFSGECSHYQVGRWTREELAQETSSERGIACVANLGKGKKRMQYTRRFTW